MIYPAFVWMSYGWYSEGWWKEPATDCTVDQMQRAIWRSLSFHHFPLPMKDEQDAPTDVIYVSKQCVVGSVLVKLTFFVH